MTNSRRKLVVPVLILVSGISGWAQERPNGFFLTSPLSVSSGYDDNFIGKGLKQDDIVSLLSAPAFTWAATNHRTRWTIDYEPEFEFFARQPDLNAWNHDGKFRFIHQINSRLSVDGGDLFLSTMDPARMLSNSVLLLPRGRYNQNSAYFNVGYRWDQSNKLSFRVDHAFTTMDLQGTYAKRLDQMTTAGTVTWDHAFTSSQKLSVAYSFLHVNPFHPEVQGDPTNVQLYVAGYDYDVRPDLLLRLSGGFVKGSDSSFTGAASVEKRLGELWVAAAYQRYLSFFGGVAPLAGTPVPDMNFATGLTPAAVYQVVGVRAWGKLSKRVGLEGSAQRALNRLDPQFRAVRGVIAGLRLDYKLSPRVTAFARGDHYAENINIFTNSSYSRNRYFGGFEIALYHAPEKENAGYKHGKIPQDSFEVPPLETTKETPTEDEGK